MRGALSATLILTLTILGVLAHLAANDANNAGPLLNGARGKSLGNTALTRGFIGGFVGPVHPATGAVSIAVSPHIVMVNGAVRVTCKVSRSAANRGLFLGLVAYRSSFKQLDGDSRVTWEETYAHVPCAVTGAFCDLRSDRQRPDVVTVPVIVAGCEP